MRRLALDCALVLATLAGLSVFWELRGAALIFFLSLGTSAALRPAIEQLHRWGLPKTLALLVTYLGCVLGVVGLTLALSFPLTRDVQQLAGDFHKAYEAVNDQWPTGNAFQRAIARRMPPWQDLQRVSWRSASAAVADKTIGETDPVKVKADSPWWTPHAVQTVIGATWGFFGTILNLLIIVVLSLYWSIDRVHFERLWLSLLGVEQRKRARETWRAIEQATGAYLQREAVQSLAAGLLLGLGFWAMGQPYPALAAAVAALAWLIPWIGAPLAMLLVTTLWLPSVALSGTASVILIARAAVYTILVLLTLEWLVEPRLFPSKRYNPILLVLVAVGMVDWLGLLGLLLAPPIAAAVQILGNQFLVQRATTATPAADVTPQSLALRLSTLRARMEDDKEISEETRAMVARLNALVEQARDLLGNSATPEHASTPAQTPPPGRRGNGP